jgi:hypothetical protein
MRLTARWMVFFEDSHCWIIAAIEKWLMLSNGYSGSPEPGLIPFASRRADVQGLGFDDDCPTFD